MLERILLFPYWLTLKIRHSLYDRGVLKSYPCEVPTICVGNITAGGTGKTPHTEMILDALLESGEWGFKNLAVLSRGHKRKSRGFQQVTRDGSARLCGDEPLQIKRRYPSVTVAVDRTRVEGCRFLCHPDLLKTDKKGAGCRDKEIQPADLIILDDAFQYRRLRAWMNIVLVDWNRPLTKDRLLPFGRLRDLPERINKADIVIVSKCPAYMENWEKSGWVRSMGIEGFDPETCTGTNAEGRKVKVFFTCIRYRELEPVYAGEADSRFVYSKKLILFSGIAKDTPLRMYLSDKYKIVKRFTFSDHHNYTRMDIRMIMGAASSHPTAVVVCTEKDSQRVLDNKSVPGELKNRLFQIPIKVAFLTEEESAIFSETLQNSLREFHSEYAQTPRG